MNTLREPEQLVVKDCPVKFWTFYSCFIVGGSIAVALSFSEAKDLLLIFGLIVGFGNVCGGAYMLWREPATLVEIQKNSGLVRINRKWLIGRKCIVYRLDELNSVDVEIGEHTDGGAIYRPVLHFGEGTEPISIFWYQERKSSDMVVEEVQRFISRSNP